MGARWPGHRPGGPRSPGRRGRGTTGRRGGGRGPRSPGTSDGLEFRQGAHHGVGHLVDRPVVGVDHQVGGRLVERVAGGGQALEDGLRIAIGQQRAAGTVAHPSGQRLRGGPQPDHRGVGQRRPVLLAAQHAASRRQDDRVLGGQLQGEALGLDVAEGLLTALVEDDADGAAGQLGHGPIEVHVAPTGPKADRRADRRLAHPHQPDERHVTATAAVPGRRRWR